MTDRTFDLEKFRFDWNVLPAISSDIVGTGGRTRVCLEDFVVSEISRFLPSGAGEFAFAYVEKRGLNTHDLVAALRERGVRYNDVGIAGLKDKRAVTRQWLSVPSEHVRALEDWRNCRERGCCKRRATTPGCDAATCGATVSRCGCASRMRAGRTWLDPSSQEFRN